MKILLDGYLCSVDCMKLAGKVKKPHGPKIQLKGVTKT
jgi:hypothetical protein